MKTSALVAISILVAGCNLIGPSTGTSGQLYAFNGSTQDVVIRTTEANPYGGSKVTLWRIPAGDDGFVASLGDAAKVEVLTAADCAVLATLDPIRGRVTALIKDDGTASFEGLPPDSSTPPPSTFQNTTTCAT